MNVSSFFGQISSKAFTQASDAKLDVVADTAGEVQGAVSSSFQKVKAGTFKILSKVAKKMPQTEGVVKFSEAIEDKCDEAKRQGKKADVSAAKQRIKKVFHNGKARLALKVAILARAASLATSNEVDGELFRPISSAAVELVSGSASYLGEKAVNLTVDTMSLEAFVMTPGDLSTPFSSFSSIGMSAPSASRSSLMGSVEALMPFKSETPRLVLGEEGAELLKDITLVAKDAVSTAARAGRNSVRNLFGRITPTASSN